MTAHMASSGEVSITGISVAAGQSIVGAVTQSGESLIVADAEKDERFTKSVDDETGFVTKSIICVPLKNEYETIGCIELINKRSGAPFTEYDLALCGQLASLAAVAIDEKGFVFEPERDKRVIISLRGVTKEYPSGDGVSRVLKGIDLDIYEDEFVVILGESGCGKSTLVNIIAGMDNLTDGTLLVNGQNFSHPSESELTSYRRNYLGFVFQSYNLMPNLTAQENVQFIAEIAKEPMSAAEAIEKVGLSERANNYPSALSGGQQQRVSIARFCFNRRDRHAGCYGVSWYLLCCGGHISAYIQRLADRREHPAGRESESRARTADPLGIHHHRVFPPSGSYHQRLCVDLLCDYPR